MSDAIPHHFAAAAVPERLRMPPGCFWLERARTRSRSRSAGVPRLRHARAPACRVPGGVRVNRELAADIYRRVPGDPAMSRAGFVSPQEADAGGVRVRAEMRRFDEATLAGLIAAGRLTDRQLDSVARRLARFHEGAPVSEGGAPARRCGPGGPTWTSWSSSRVDRRGRGGPVASARRSWQRTETSWIAARRRPDPRRARRPALRARAARRRTCASSTGSSSTPRLRRIDVGCDLAFLRWISRRASSGRAARRADRRLPPRGRRSGQ